MAVTETMGSTVGKASMGMEKIGTMNTTWKSNWDETKQRYLDWWNQKGLLISMWEHLEKDGEPHEDVPKPEDARDLEQFWFDPEWRARYLHWKLSRSSFKGEILPVADANLGPGSLAACLGSGMSPAPDTVWITHDPDFDGTVKFDENNKWWKLHVDLLTECKKMSQGRYLIGCPDLMENLDTLSSMRGAEGPLLDILVEPDQLKEQVQAVNDFHLQVFDRIYEIIREGDEMAWCYFSIWGPGKVAKLQCDLSTMISAEHFDEFVLPYLIQQVNHMDYTLYHLDGVGAMHHADSLIGIEKLNAIQWTPGYGEPQGGSPRWYPLYKKILDGGKSVMACWVEVDELEALLDNIGAEGVSCLMHFKTESDIDRALEIAEKFR